MQELAPVLSLVAVAALFWLVLIRPQQRRIRELRVMQSALDVGDEVILTSGIYGTLVESGEDDVKVEIADGVTIRVARGAIGQLTTTARLDAVEPEEN